MLGATYVKRHPRTGGYYFRRRVPDHLKPTIGTVEIIRSLATKSLDEATSDRMKKDLALTALKRALAVRQPTAGIIHHSDRGSQYCSDAYRKLLKDHGIVASMSGKGNCYDIAIGRYIDGFYNPVRRHSALEYRSPCRFEAEAA